LNKLLGKKETLDKLPELYNCSFVSANLYSSLAILGVLIGRDLTV
jgi:hypothetical protein